MAKSVLIICQQAPEHSLTERNLTPAQLTLSTKVITKERLAKLLIHYDVVITN